MPDGWPRSSTPSTRSSAGPRTSSGRPRSATGACRRSRFEETPARTESTANYQQPTSKGGHLGSWKLVVGSYPSLSPLILDSGHIERLLPMGDCIAVMEQAFADLQR